MDRLAKDYTEFKKILPKELYRVRVTADMLLWASSKEEASLIMNDSIPGTGSIKTKVEKA